MIPYNPIHSLSLGPFTIKTWGLFVGVAFLVALTFAGKQLKHLSQKHITNLSILALVGGIIGGRIGYILLNITEVKSIWQIFAVWEGGMAFFGGFIAAFLLIILYLRKNNLNTWKLLDTVAPAMALGHAIGRIGCIVAGFHIGKVTSVPWAVNYFGQPRHPTPIYSIIHLLLLFYVLLKLRTKKLFEGAILLIYLVWYSVGRFIIEFFRVEPLYFGLTSAQWISVFVATCSLYLFIVRARKHKLSIRNLIQGKNKT